MRLSDFSYVIGRREGKGDLRDVRIHTTPEGYNSLEIARDTEDIEPKTYAIERRLLPDGNWYRLITTKSFDPSADPNELGETRANVTFESFSNDWGIKFEETWGLPAGMESPWAEPLEMVGNELLLPSGVGWVSGDAPTNIFRESAFTNGKYRIEVNNGSVAWRTRDGESLGTIRTDTTNLRITEGTAGAASFTGGMVYAEPAKPIMFMGRYVLEELPLYVRPGLYRYGNGYLISSKRLSKLRDVGILAFVSDPFPERWVPRMMGRAFVDLTSPVYVAPFVEEEPERVGVSIIYPTTDFPDLEPRVVTPYANETGVFNAWEVGLEEVKYRPAERPWDVLLPMENRREDWGGLPFDSQQEHSPALDAYLEARAAAPNPLGYELKGLPLLPRGALVLRWKDSSHFRILESRDLNITYKRGYVYFRSVLSPGSNGIAKINVGPGWNSTKLEWGDEELWVNEQRALVEERSWHEATEGASLTWGEVGNIPFEKRIPTPENPLFLQEEELLPEWVTGEPEDVAKMPNLYYHKQPRTWGRVLYEAFEADRLYIMAGDMNTTVAEIADRPVWSAFPRIYAGDMSRTVDSIKHIPVRGLR